ncbi:ABC transporter ATP-binding protein [Belliella sp. DSM 107340]|uniref:ABC transporter ATP-binding protein n=1 Tax=Belliella calami TaxID=2923436 RepID=A0ABS9UIS5_9BACT|nr:ABC transporter ATP-binding protein [Belliella calami]MCH7396517.1 ABC transporter ATP-binding protein [Belliella calami]
MAIIKVENLSKRYRLGLKEKQAKTLIGQLSNIFKSPYDNFKKLRSLSKFKHEQSFSEGQEESVFWALKDINFEVQQGEVLGIIGKNGAGKSTLLKILSQITEPTTGRIEMHGRVASLLEVGTGFHPELSGRENIYMNGTILGMTKREIDIKLDEIIDFSGVEKFIDTPVKFYSSGMKVRLGFSVAAHLNPEILIIDEVLAVGDYEFQQKCLGKMEDVSKNQGRTVLFVSHNMVAVENICSKILLVEDGGLKYNGQVSYGIGNYLNTNNYFENLHIEKDGVLLQLLFENSIIKSGSSLNMSIILKSEFNYVGLSLALGFNKNSQRIFTLNSFYQTGELFSLMNLKEIKVSLENLVLIQGVYDIVVTLYQQGTKFREFYSVGKLDVKPGDYFNTGHMFDSNYQGNILIKAEWEM